VRRWRSRLFFFLVIVVSGYVWLGYQKEHRYDGFITDAATRYQVSPALVKAVVWQESRFNPRVRGRAGEIGLMQIRSAAANEWATAEGIEPFEHEMIFDPALNTRAGAWYLGKLTKRYLHTDDPIPYALADYNAGRTHVLRWNDGVAETNSAAFIEQITFPTTKKYIENVMRRYKTYSRDMRPANPS